jgi:hypothetical protein
MQFLAPLFFLALAGLAIPVLLHLTQREKKQIIHFPSLMFVRRIPYQAVRRRKIQNWLLLMVRLAALAMIILAFARPLFRRDDAPVVTSSGAREVVVLLDTSYSMAYGDRWERARAAAHDAINGLTAGDRGSVVLFSSGAEIALRSAPERAALSGVVANAKPGASATRYAPALKVAGSIMAESQLPRREVVLISDFQRGGWRGEEGARLPQGTVLTPVPVIGATDRPNLSVSAVSLARSTFSQQERVTVTAGVVNRTDRPVNTSSIRLMVDGLSASTKPLSVEPGGSASVTFEPVTVSKRNMRGTVSIPDDALAADNAFHFVLSPEEPVRVAVIDRSGSGPHLSRALLVAQAPRFEAVTRQPDSLTDDDLRRSDVVLLNDVAVQPPLARRLARFVEQGGGLLVAAGSRATWPSDVDLLPGTIDNPVDKTRTEARVGAIEYAHPVFEPLRAARSGNFSSVAVYGYRRITPAASAQIVARFDGSSPALLERRVGTGRVLLWGTTLDISWNDLPLSKVYVPFVHRSLRHLSAYTEPRPWLTVGQVLDPAAAAAPRADATPNIALTPSGRRLPIDDEGDQVMELAEQGFYELRNQNSPEAVVVAANVDPAEADLTPMDPKEIVAAATGDPANAQGGGATTGVPLTAEAQERNQRLWWYLLVAGILLLAADTLMSNRLAKT